MWTVAQLAADLDRGRTTSRELVEQALAKINDPNGEGKRAFLEVQADGARAAADYSDRLRKQGARRSPVEGLPVSIKDLFDVAGEVTRAGSKIFERRASSDAAAVARLRAAGAVFVGRTNMVEFAFGGVGLNPHYGTPKNPWDRKSGRVPGGSSSGAAVAQADGMCVMALGSDTGGSVRIPSALCGLAGFKPTQRRVPLDGAFPLSTTLDSIGPLANSIACCAAYDAVLAGEPAAPLPQWPAKGLRLALPRSGMLEELDPQVEKAFGLALERLRAAGAAVVETPAPVFDRRADYFKKGGFAGAEAYHIHRDHLDRLGGADPRVAHRILLGKDMAAADYVALLELRAAAKREYEALAASCDAIVMPTIACVAPTIAEAGASDDGYLRWNLRILRNCAFTNFLDGCAATLPCHVPGSAPVGLMLCGGHGADRRLLAVAAAIEKALARD